LGSYWGNLGIILAILGHLRVILGNLGAISGGVLAILGHLRFTLATLGGPSWGHGGTILGLSYAFLGRSREAHGLLGQMYKNMVYLKEHRFYPKVRKLKLEGSCGHNWSLGGESRIRLRQNCWENSIWGTSHAFWGSWPVSEGLRARFEVSRGPGKCDHAGAPWFWQRFWGVQGGEGGTEQLTEG
jgi:hypothetical protein